MRGWRPWTVQPPPGTPIDWDSPLAEGLVDVIDMRGFPRSVLLQTPATLFGTSQQFGQPTSQGLAFDTNASYAGVYFSRADGKYATAAQTHIAVATYQSFSGLYAGFFAVSDQSGNGSLSLQYASSTDVDVYVSNSVGVTLIYLAASLTGTPFVLGLAVGGGSAAIYLNGVHQTGFSIQDPSTYSTSRLVIFGERTATTSYAAKGTSPLHLFYDRVLGSEPLSALGHNPWQIFHRRRRAYSIPTSSGATGTAAITEGADATSATGSVAISGTASITEASDTVAATGAIAVAGTAAITEGSDAVAATGVGGEVGTAAITEADDAVSASGALSVTGSAGITEGVDTVAATGAAGAGATAAITEQHDATAATGGIALSGAATIFEGGDIVVASGALGLAGSASITEAPDSVAATGSGPQPANPMPNFIGFPINYVIQILAAQGLAASLTYQIADPPGTTMGLITAQSPAPGQQLKAPVSFTCTGAIALPAVGVRSGNVPALLVGNNDNPGGRSTNS